MEQEYILLILNCNKYAYKKKIQEKLWVNHIPLNIKHFYVRGDPTLTSHKFDLSNNILYVNCKDDYVSLPQKTIKAIRAIKETFNFKYIFKTDDDQMLINKSFFTDLTNELPLEKYDYGGFTLDVGDHVSTYRLEETQKEIFVKGCSYCNGRFYLLSDRACEHILQKETEFEEYVFEDHAVGYMLTDFENLKRKRFTTQLGDFMDIPMYIENNYFIHTECINCPEICVNAIKSFSKENKDIKLNVFLTLEDLEYIKNTISEKDYENISFNIVNDNMKTIYRQNGHQGTAILWNYVIQYSKENNLKIIHVDSDVYFRGDIVYDIILDMESGYDIVGGCRPYGEFNKLNNTQIRDTVSTYCFGYNPKFISSVLLDNDDIIIAMLRGFYNPIGHRVMDFFDPVTFHMLEGGANMKHIDKEVIGYLDTNMEQNSYAKRLKILDVAEKIIHFSAVGSGLAYRKGNKKTNVPMTYIEAGIKSLEFYEYLFYNKEFNGMTEQHKEVKKWFDTEL
jgi:hypothetical protein